MSGTRWLYRFSDPLPAGGDAVAWCGNKGASLRCLQAAGLPVPAGCTITTEACRQYFALDRRFPADLNEQLNAAVADLERETGSVYAMAPQPLLLAVRSGAAVSMPGMLLTLLHCGLTWDFAQARNDAAVWQDYAGLIRELARAQGAELSPANEEHDRRDESGGREACARLLQEYEVRVRQPFPQDARELLRTCVAAVFDSWWTPRATAYRRLHRIDNSLATAVTVQAMIATEVAGVLFSRDPQQGDSATFLVEAVRGTGDQLVAGRVVPERYVVERGRVVAAPGTGLDETALRPPRWACDGDESKAPTRDASVVRQACLREAERHQLCRLGLRIEELLGGDVDVEWGLAPGRWVIFQARLMDEPRAGQQLAQVRLAEIERLDRSRRELGTRLWVPHNLGETLTAPTPLTWDVIRRLTSGGGAFGRLYRSLGYTPSRRVCEHGFLELIAGRIYADPDRMVEMFCDGWPLGCDLTALRANPRLIDRNPTCFAPERTDALWLFRLPAILWTMFRAARRVKREAPRAAERFDQQALPSFRAYVASEHARSLRELADCDLVAVLDDRCRQVLDEFGAEFLRPGLFAGLAVTSLETQLVQLLGPEDGSRCVRTLVSGLGTDADANLEVWFHRLAHGQVGLPEFVEQCGHRGPNELELAAPRWCEIPGQAVQWADWLRESAASDPADLRARAADERKRTMRSLPETLQTAGAGSFAGRIAEDAELAQRLLPYRERARHYWLMGYGLIRDAVQEIARRCGLDDGIFFLKLDEIRQFPSAADTWQEVIGDRQQQWQWQQRLTVPDVIESTYLEAIGNADSLSPAAMGTLLDGTSLSPGVAQGPVWVLNAGQPTTTWRNGAVLVCSALDPGLVALLLTACAVVVERGGMLSHGAIVARQIGLPVVVASQATRLLHDGQVVVVDADRGCVLCPVEGEP